MWRNAPGHAMYLALTTRLCCVHARLNSDGLAIVGAAVHAPVAALSQQLAQLQPGQQCFNLSAPASLVQTLLSPPLHEAWLEGTADKLPAEHALAHMTACYQQALSNGEERFRRGRAAMRARGRTPGTPAAPWRAAWRWSCAGCCTCCSTATASSWRTYARAPTAAAPSTGARRARRRPRAGTACLGAAACGTPSSIQGIHVP